MLAKSAWRTSQQCPKYVSVCFPYTCVLLVIDFLRVPHMFVYTPICVVCFACASRNVLDTALYVFWYVSYPSLCHDTYPVIACMVSRVLLMRSYMFHVLTGKHVSWLITHRTKHKWNPQGAYNKLAKPDRMHRSHIRIIDAFLMISRKASARLFWQMWCSCCSNVRWSVDKKTFVNWWICWEVWVEGEDL